MKNYITYILISIVLCSCDENKSTSFSIDGLIEDINDSTEVYLSYIILNNGRLEEVSDTAYIENGKFYFKGIINELVAANLVFKDVDVPIYLEPTNIKLVIDKNNPYAYKLLGTSVEKENIELRNILSDYMKTYYQISDSIQEIFKLIDLHNNQPHLVDSLMKKAYDFKENGIINAEKLDSMRLDFVVKHNTYQITPHVLYILSKNNLISNDTIEAVYTDLPEYSKTALLGKLALEQIKQTKRYLNKKDILVGDIAPDFSKQSIQGQTIKLSDFRNKHYILLDFWANWCGPCVKQIPQINKLQDIYANKGLRIIGVSLDGNEEEWRNAVEEYELGKWIHVLSYNDPSAYFSNSYDISEIYNISSIPLYILIDKQGKVIARWQHIGDKEIAFMDKLLR